MSTLDKFLSTEIGVILFTLCLILALAPYFGGKDFGIFSVPQFTPREKRFLKRFGPFGVLVSVLLFLQVWPEPLPPPPIEHRGRVVDARDSTPVASARVVLTIPTFHGEAQTDTGGRYNFQIPSSLAGQSGSLTATATRFQQATRSVIVGSNAGLFEVLMERALVKVVVMDSRSRVGVLTRMKRELVGVPGIEVSDRPLHDDWLEQTAAILSEQVELLIVHWHALRSNYTVGARDQLAEDDLLRGLYRMTQQSPRLKIVLFSSSFARQDTALSRRDVRRAAERVASQDHVSADAYSLLAASIELVPWSDSLRAADRARLHAAVIESIR